MQEGRPWWLLALQGGALLTSSRGGGADLLSCRLPTCKSTCASTDKDHCCRVADNIIPTLNPLTGNNGECCTPTDVCTTLPADTSDVSTRMSRSGYADRQPVLRGGGAMSGGMLLADLAGLGQPQAYAVSKGCGPGSGTKKPILQRC